MLKIGPQNSAEMWVVKAQIHSGARGKAGGIIVCKKSARGIRCSEQSPREKISYKSNWP